MKKRTRVMAWIFFVLHLAIMLYLLFGVFVGLAIVDYFTSYKTLNLVLLFAFNLMFILGYTGLLKDRIWAWRMLIVCIGLAVGGVLFELIASILVFQAPVHASYCGTARAIAGSLLLLSVAALMVSSIPLATLIIDRPSRWKISIS